MHTFIIIGDDIYTLDTDAERAEAAAALTDAGIERAPVYRGGPEGNEAPEGRDFGADGQFHYDGIVGCYQRTCHRPPAMAGLKKGLVG